MIARLKGTLWESQPFRLVVDVGGVGYAVWVPILENMPSLGMPIELFTHAIYREDAATLYGFLERAQRDLFVTLVEKVSGIGPKTALGLLAHLGCERVWAAIEEGNVAALTAAPGIGKKTAERLVLEMRGLSAIKESAQTSSAVTDAIAALVSLGFGTTEAQKNIGKLAEKMPKASTDELLRAALRPTKN